MAFVGTRGAVHTADQTVECEDKAAYCGVYGLTKAVRIFGILKDKVTVNFNRRAGGLDISLPLEISPEDQVHHSTCMLKIIEKAKAALQ